MWFSCAFLKTYGNKVTLPGDCHVASLLAMTQYFVQNKTHSLKSQNFDAIKPHKYTVSCGDPEWGS